MHRIDGPGATVDNKFTEGDPVAGVEATTVTDDWLNDVQENIMAVLAAAGVAPVKGDASQLLAAMIGRMAGYPRVFDASATYIPTPGAKWAIADVQAAGGQGGGSPAGNATQIGFGTGGHSGSRVVARFSLVGVVSLLVTVGLGGSTGTAGAAGQIGGASSVGGLISCPGGAGGGLVGPTAGPSIIANSAAYPVPTVGGGVNVIVSQQGNAGQYGLVISSGIAISGTGGASPGYSLNLSANIGTGTGSPGTQKGQGGSGAFSAINAAAQKGGDGAAGKVIIWEFF